MLSAQAYSPYGEPMFTDMPTEFGFTGEQTDPTNDLVYLRARYMNPRLGIFGSLDPFEGEMSAPLTMNGYDWVEGNTPNLTDATGRSTGTCQAPSTNLSPLSSYMAACNVYSGDTNAHCLFQNKGGGGGGGGGALGLVVLTIAAGATAISGARQLTLDTPSHGLLQTSTTATMELSDFTNDFALPGFAKKVGTIAEHLAKILARDVAGYPASKPNPNGDPDRGWCDTIKRAIQEIDGAGYSKKQLAGEIGKFNLGGTWDAIRKGVEDVIVKGLCKDHWGDFGGGSFAGG